MYIYIRIYIYIYVYIYSYIYIDIYIYIYIYIYKTLSTFCIECQILNFIIIQQDISLKQ